MIFTASAIIAGMSLARQENPTIVHGLEFQIGPIEYLRAYVNGAHVGSLIYYKDYENGGWGLEDLGVREEFRGQGIARSLLRAFVGEVGRGQPVRGIFSHDETVDFLGRRYIAVGASGQYQVPEAELAGIPIVKVLSSGEIDVLKVTVIPDPPGEEFEPYEIAFSGRTR